MASNAVHTTLTDKDRRGGLTVTVVLTNYNHSRFLRESLGSLLNQTRPAEEYIIIDDASTDDSVAVILDLISRVPEAKLVKNPNNIGCVAGMNKGLSMAKGDIVLFAAADDVFYPELLKVGVQLMEAYPQAAIFSARSDLLDAAGLNKGRFHSPQPLTRPGFLDATTALGHMLRDDGWFMGNTALYRRSALLAEGKFDEKLGSFADGYIYRWRRRYLFGGRRFALRQHNAVHSGPSGCVKSTFNHLRILWLFLALRPWDISVVLRRWIWEYWNRRRPTARPNLSK
jgi:glycosyltransferase involved in cell wall biosynthesis